MLDYKIGMGPLEKRILFKYSHLIVLCVISLFPWDRIGAHILFLFDEGLLYAVHTQRHFILYSIQAIQDIQDK